jgi:hypothetical protein
VKAIGMAVFVVSRVGAEIRSRLKYISRPPEGWLEAWE